ncbi:MAG: di-trans,poly-cis-decaprenylcistransferase [Bryobacteraceae bacterium]|nr:di-trans,poly-cis-decaprenylcistransferase [Bryobacteraceae bacterium]
MHTAIIMDGNGRWAVRKGLPRLEGHRRGAQSIRRVLEAAPALGVNDLTLYAFSSDNWLRPAEEVSGLMALFGDYLRSEADRCREKGVRLSVIGRRDRLAPELIQLIGSAERLTRSCSRLHLRLAVDYSSRDELLNAARSCSARGRWTREEFSAALPAPAVDLLIRTAGEQRLSDFLLWECAYAEFVFVERLWPDFDAADLADAMRLFTSRQRKFGALPAA